MIQIQFQLDKNLEEGCVIVFYFFLQDCLDDES